MGEFQDLVWTPRFAGLNRSQARSGHYKAFIPVLLKNRLFVFDGQVVADIADAERAIARLDAGAVALSDTEGLARLLLRAESVASSRIEGLEVSAQRLLRYDAARAENDQSTDATAEEILGNIDAMALAVSSPREITLDRILAVHERLMAPTKMAGSGGHVRTEQNWIGGTLYSPFGASFVPPPPECVDALLRDLVEFCNRDDLAPIAQAAIAHAQFETIHPFLDGNGRTGRALIHMIFRKRGLTPRTLIPVSLVLATHANDYVSALNSMRIEEDATSQNVLQTIIDWIGFFAGACTRAVQDAQAFEFAIERIVGEWKGRLAHLRADATALRLIDRLPGMPLVTPRSVERALGTTYTTANSAIEALVNVQILTSTRTGRRNRAFEARAIVDAFTAFERQLASPVGDTKIAAPVRNVPAFPDR